MNLDEAISVLQSHVRAGQDLPEELFVFITTVTPMVNVDLLIQDVRKRTLLTWRDDKQYGAGWHIPGGIIRFKEHALERVQKVAQTELGCSVAAEPVPILIIETLSETRERGHFISLLYRCKLAGDPARYLQSGEIPEHGQWRWHEGAPADLLPLHRMYTEVL